MDYSQGALFFIQRSAAEKQNVVWFDKDLKKLFKYGVHEFYTYPDENDSGKDGIKDSGEEADVQLAEKIIFWKNGSHTGASCAWVAF